MNELKAAIIDVPDFPKPGVLFRDISGLLASPRLFSLALDGLAGLVKLDEVDVVVGIESRGFILGAALAARHGKGFIPLRKAGKLPPPVQSQAYALEYGTAELEVKAGHGRALIVDDVLATGGTLYAAISLTERAGFTVSQVAVLINLTFLNEMTYQGKKIPAVLEY
jgi:adenine phosphoribosyltransferase